MLKQLYKGLITAGDSLQSVFLLAIRLLWGWQFFQAGVTKFQDIDTVIGYFTTMGIFSPTLSAYAVAATESIGGALLLLGFATRLACIPLMVVMVVALFLTYPESLHSLVQDPTTFMMQTPFTFFLAALILFIFGPGKLSLDALIKRFT